jgi:hypothetical protein
METPALVRALLGEKYGIDYYQREYRWEQKHVDALLQDIETRFMASYDPGDSRPKVVRAGEGCRAIADSVYVNPPIERCPMAVRSAKKGSSSLEHPSPRL